MRYTKKLLPLSLLSLLLVSATTTKVSPHDGATLMASFYLEMDEVMGGFDNTSESIDFRFKIKNNLKDLSKEKLTIEGFYVSANARYLLNEYICSDIVDSEGYMNVSIDIKNRLQVTGGIYLRFNVYEYALRRWVVRSNTEVTLYPKINNTIYSYEYRSEPYRIEDRTFLFVNNALQVENDEIMQFQDTIDYLTNNEDNSLSINEISFTYNRGHELINKTEKKYLKFRDSKNYFSRLRKDADGYSFVELECHQDNEDITFSILEDSLYYNSENLTCSYYPLLGANSKADKLYIPKKAVMSDLEGYEFFIEMNDFGRAGTNVKIPLSFIKDKNFIGQCGGSNYCIIGGIKE